MLFLLVLVGLLNLVTTSPLIAHNITLAPGHYLSESITNRTFYNNSCTPETASIRKEWRSLTHTEKMAFVNAELCLMSLPGRSGLPGAQSHFDDFQAAHQQGTNTSDGDIIHYTPQFLAWHRWQLHAHEQILRLECNYTGTIPFWDEALDASSGSFFQSDMWTNTYFGGNGSSTNNCVTTGPFANRTLHVGPLETTTDYCFARKWNETKGLDYGRRTHVDSCYEYVDFESFYGCMAYYPHIAGHQATGGVVCLFIPTFLSFSCYQLILISQRMTDVDSSPGDPIFYLHHNYLDRLYWQWQQLNATARLNYVAGSTTINEPAAGWEAMTLDYEMNMYGIVNNVTIGDVTNIQGGYLCYAFEY